MLLLFNLKEKKNLFFLNKVSFVFVLMYSYLLNRLQKIEIVHFEAGTINLIIWNVFLKICDVWCFYIILFLVYLVNHNQLLIFFSFLIKRKF